MVHISSQLISLLKDLQNTQASVVTLTDETGLPNGVMPGDELKATVVGKLSDLYLIQVDDRLIRARTQLPLQRGDGLRLRVMDNNTPVTVRILEHMTQQPQPSTASEVKTFMAMKAALFHVSPQIESLLENIPTRGASISNLPEGIQYAVSVLNALAQGDTAQPDKIRALFSLFASDVPKTFVPDTVSNSMIFMRILQEGLDAIQERLPFVETSSKPTITTPLNAADDSVSTHLNTPQAVHVQDSPAFGKSYGVQAPLSSVDNAQQSVRAAHSMTTDAANVETGLKAGLQSSVQPEAGIQPTISVDSEPLAHGPSFTTQAQAEPKGSGLAARPVWLYEAKASLQRDGFQQAALPQLMSQDLDGASGKSQVNILQGGSISPGAQQSATHVSIQTPISNHGQVQALEMSVTPTSSSPENPVTAQADMRATNGLTAAQNIQAAPARQAIGMSMAPAVETIETGVMEGVNRQQQRPSPDIQRVQSEISGHVQAHSSAVSSNIARSALQEGMIGAKFEQSAGIVDEQIFGVAPTAANGQETEVRVALHTMNLLAQHMDRMQVFRLELQQQTGMNFWLIPLWFNGGSGSGHMIWWQDKEDEQKDGKPDEGQGYNLLFDLQLSRLGSLKLRLSCSGKAVQCFVAAEKEALPVIRSGIEELRARLDSVGFSLRLAELSALSGLESKAFDPLGSSLNSANGVLNIVA